MLCEVTLSKKLDLDHLNLKTLLLVMLAVAIMPLTACSSYQAVPAGSGEISYETNGEGTVEGAGRDLSKAEVVTPTSVSTVTPSPTSTLISTPRPTHTATVVPSATSSSTYTPSPSPSATSTATPAPPSPTPIPSPSPTAGVDFRLKSWRLWPAEQNGNPYGEGGGHIIFIIVEDINEQPLDGVVVGDTWNNVEDVSGRKGPGLAEIDLYANTMEITVKRDQLTGQPYTSEASPPCASYITTISDEQLVTAGYFSNEIEAQWNRQNNSYFGGGHFSWEVIFQRTY